MFKNYIKIVSGNLLRKIGHAATNNVGSALSISACLVIFLSVYFEPSMI